MSHESPDKPAPWKVLDDLYERALKRFLEGSEFDYRDYLDEEEQAQYAAAEEAELAQVGSPETGDTKQGKVVIEVLGGVAYLMSQPEGVEVEIIDRDNQNESEVQ